MDPFLIVMIVVLGAMLLMSSRTRKAQKQAAAFRANLEPGQEVMTASGLFGTVVAVDDDVITLETSPGVTSRWLRPAIGKLVEPTVPLGAEEAEDDELEDDELLDDEVDRETFVTDVDDDRPVHGREIEVPDDASSLTDGPDRDERSR